MYQCEGCKFEVVEKIFSDIVENNFYISKENQERAIKDAFIDMMQVIIEELDEYCEKSHVRGFWTFKRMRIDDCDLERYMYDIDLLDICFRIVKEDSEEFIEYMNDLNFNDIREIAELYMFRDEFNDFYKVISKLYLR